MDQGESGKAAVMSQPRLREGQHQKAPTPAGIALIILAPWMAIHRLAGRVPESIGKLSAERLCQKLWGGEQGEEEIRRVAKERSHRRDRPELRGQSQYGV